MCRHGGQELAELGSLAGQRAGVLDFSGTCKFTV